MNLSTVVSAACTDRGMVRANNEDAIAIDRGAGIFIVCDGMGGAAAGEIASRFTAAAVLSALKATPQISIEEAIHQANCDLLAAAARDQEHSGMGTTLVALVVAENVVRVAHVGDSRCYRLRAGALEQITQDHSFVAEQVLRGLMTQEEAARSPMRNVITRAVGTSEQVEVEITEWQLAADDLFLLASDGLTREVDDKTIANILQTAHEPKAACNALVAAANAAGGHDNISCIVVRFASAGGTEIG